MTLTFANLVGNSGTIFSFEPEPDNFRMLKQNIELNNFNNTSAYNLAVSDSEKMLSLYLSNDSNSGTHSTIFNKTSVSENYIEVKAISLDDFVKKNNLNKIDLIKIDVEGAEIDVVNGMDNILKKNKPILIIELVSGLQTNRNLSTKDFKHMMSEKYDYNPYMINNNGEIVKVAIEYEHLSDNVVFIHSEDKLNNKI
jgi:FkbM family methyltransferase